MQSFTQALSNDEWTEVLLGGYYLAFDLNRAGSIQLCMTETEQAPAHDVGSVPVASWPAGWDFEATRLRAGTQRIWLRGSGQISGVRA